MNTAEATYIWTCSKDKGTLKGKIEEIDSDIGLIKQIGKSKYLQKEDEVRRIYHDYSDNEDGFLKWKNELETLVFNNADYG